MKVVDFLVKEGIDFIEISGGSYESPTMITGTAQAEKSSTRKREAFFLHYAEALRKQTHIPLAITGGFRSSEGMEHAINSGATDFVGLARPMILKPDLPLAALTNPHFVYQWKEPTTGFEKLDRMTMLALIWYEKQMWRVGRGKQTKLNQSTWLAALTSIWKVITSPPAVRRS
jgi:2,4-dienoyl-CoA reductase-like NADH-dependent reductase (Old Yellow Enzyme family)